MIDYDMNTTTATTTTTTKATMHHSQINQYCANRVVWLGWLLGR